MHSNYFISYALNLAGIKDDVKNPPQGGFYEKDENGKLRVFLYRDGVAHRKREKISFSNAFFKFLGHKYWADGSPYTGTMLLREPYVDSDLVINKLSIERKSLGQSILPVQVFEDFTKSDAEEGMQIAIHAQGDSAVSNTLSALQNAISLQSGTDGRHRLEHLALVTEDQINTMAEMGITPSFHINHIYYYGDFLARIVGEE